MANYVFGIDVGGTSVKCGLFQTDFNGIDTDPNTKFRNIRTRIDATMSDIRKVVECLIRAAYLSRA